MLWGDGSPTREFLFVDDCVEGLVLAGGALRRRRAGQPRHRRRDLDPRPRRDDRGLDGVRRRDRLGHVDAERPAATIARRLPGRGALRLPRAYRAPRGSRAHGCLVPRARASACGRLRRRRHPPARRRGTGSAPRSTPFSSRPRGSMPGHESCSPGSSRSSGWPSSPSPSPSGTTAGSTTREATRSGTRRAPG